ncbi:bile acid:sodium symporter family protein [Maribellus maritimus]|uniref:bile acid:sodium symporter family protein n=1 Tax=Maribellus maritimus TaxID=2870838 RepID=UPI001EEBE1C6|nr:bile acid:sodium symporter family protein [Maribellus maritimus]MCG6186647.1 bile acid:sodium symporter [Maribellus maritimus]
MKIDKFILAIIGVILLAWFFPQWGSPESSVPLDLIASVGISLIFFFYGLKLSPQQIKSGLKNWKLHILVQLSTFIVFPAIVLSFYPFIKTENGKIIWLAFLFLAALPSTVSSSVVMVSIAKGNIPAAIFNASISGLIGIVVTPLWMGLFLQQTAIDFNLGEIYVKLVTEILLPVVVGLLLQRYWGEYARKYNRYLTLFDKSVILLIIFKSFSHSFENKVFSVVDMLDLSLIIAAVILLFYAVYFFTSYFSRLLGFTAEDQITAQFCGTKKSLVHGTVFAKILFQQSATTGIMLLPIMIFHPVQILIISFVATRLGKRK